MLTNVPEISVEEYISLIDEAIIQKSNIIVLGPPGIGKTDIPAQRAEVAGIGHSRLDLSVMEAPDLIGMPVINKKSKQTQFFPPDILPISGSNILIADEVDKCKPELQNPLLSLFRYRTINKTKYSIDTIIGTANEPDNGAFSLPISMALTDRCMVFRLKFSVNAWISWAKDNRLNPIVIGFILKNPDWLIRSSKTNDLTEYNKPSPRGWTYTALHIDRLTNPDLKHKIVSGYVGEAAAIEFKVWLDYYNKIDEPIEYLVKTGEFPKNLSEDCIMVGALKAMGMAARANNLNTARNVLPWIQSLRPDFSHMSFRSVLTNDDIIRFKDLPEFKNFIEYLKERFNNL